MLVTVLVRHHNGKLYEAGAGVDYPDEWAATAAAAGLIEIPEPPQPPEPPRKKPTTSNGKN
jgi:hypothetical protein